MTRSPMLLTLSLVTVAALQACQDPGQPAGPAAVAVARPRFDQTECKPPTPDSLIPLPIAPPGKRVDLGTPAFSRSASVTNPLFPISHLSQVVLVGFVDGVPFRAETTLLPGTQSIDIGDRTVETLTSQYVAYLDRRIDETALDWYGQDDDGAVWYFGEDVANYEDGEIVDTDGTWLACKDGPVAMIMPALPRVGDVYRVENIFPTVFEEIEILEVDQTVAGPLGPVAGAFTVTQLHLDGSYAPKTFAPGYGEFSTGSASDVEALALAIPTDASPLPPPADLRALLSGARQVFHAAGTGNWTSASNSVARMNRAWVRYQASNVPRLLKPLLAEGLQQLTQAVAARDRGDSRQFALDVSRTGLDLLLQYRSRIAVDFARLDLWTRQLIIDIEAEDDGGAASDMAILRTILFRLADTGNPRDRNDARSARQHFGAMENPANHNSSSAVLDGARRLLLLLSVRIRAEES